MDANRASDNEQGSMNDLTRGGTTSALTRDAARLRSVMVQAAERGENNHGDEDHMRSEGPAVVGDDEQARSDARTREDLARATAMPSLPKLADEQVSVALQKDQRIEPKPSREQTPVPAGSRRPTALRAPSVPEKAGRSPITAQSPAGSGATALKPVEMLRSETMVKDRSAVLTARTASAAPVAASSRSEAARPEMHASAPIYTEIERKESYSYGAEEKPSTQGGRIGVDVPSPHIAMEEPGFYSRPARRRGAGVGRKVLAGVTVLVGITIGIGLYAGGGDLLSGLFSNENEGVAVISPSTVTERPVDPPAPGGVTAATPGTDEAAAPNAAPLAGQPGATLPAEASAPVPDAQSTPRPSAQATSPAAPRAGSSRPEPRVIDVEDQEPTAPTGRTQRRDARSATSATTSPAGASGNAKAVTDVDPKGKTNAKPAADKPKEPVSKVNKYLVQVRATPDEAEAKLIAKRLRGKGASNVTVVPQKGKDGTTIYRVRYSATGTNTEAQSAASRAGYRNVWVVKQNK